MSWNNGTTVARRPSHSLQHNCGRGKDDSEPRERSIQGLQDHEVFGPDESSIDTRSHRRRSKSSIRATATLHNPPIGMGEMHMPGSESGLQDKEYHHTRETWRFDAVGGSAHCRRMQSTHPNPSTGEMMQSTSSRQLSVSNKEPEQGFPPAPGFLMDGTMALSLLTNAARAPVAPIIQPAILTNIVFAT